MSPSRPSLLAQFYTFLRIGALAFGGLGGALAVIDRELVGRRGWVAAGDVRAALAFTKPLPGSTVVQVVAFLGWRIARWPGALIASVAFLIPSAALMIGGAALLNAAPAGPVISGALLGVQVAVVGLLASALLRLSRDLPARRLSLLALVAFGAGLVAVNAALVVIAAGLVWMVVGDAG